VIDAFLQRGLIAEITSLLLDLLKDDKPEDGPLQTRLLEINLMHKPTIAEAIMIKYGLSHYDKKRIADLCEKAGLAQRVRYRPLELAWHAGARFNSLTQSRTGSRSLHQH